MTQNVTNGNFKCFEVTGATKEEAFAKTPFTTPDFKNATPAFKKWKEKQTKAITQSELKQFMMDQLASTTKFAPGVACYIVDSPAVKDTRKRPYEIEDVKSEGARRFVRTYQLVDDETGCVLGSTSAEEVTMTDKDGNVLKNKDGKTRVRVKGQTKSEAKEMGRQIYRDGFKGNLTCKVTQQVFDGESIAFRMKYAPSVNASVGVYRVFGILPED